MTLKRKGEGRTSHYDTLCFLFACLVFLTTIAIWKSFNWPCWMRDSEKELLVTMTFDTSAILTEHNITHFLSGGSLLGAFRQAGMIPWDHDVDMGVSYTECKNVGALDSIFESKGYYVLHVAGRTCYFRVHPSDQYHRLNGNSLSSLFYQIFEKMVWIDLANDGKFRTAEGAGYMKKGREVAWEGGFLPTTLHVREYLRQMYGEDYMVGKPVWEVVQCDVIKWVVYSFLLTVSGLYMLHRICVWMLLSNCDWLLTTNPLRRKETWRALIVSFGLLVPLLFTAAYCLM